MSAYLICYQRCDPQYETIPHIHTEDGIFTVDEQIDGLAEDHGQKYDVVVLNDIVSFTRMNGENFPLFQSCWSCKSRFVGNQDWEWCPKCGESLPHAIRVPRSMETGPGRITIPQPTPAACPNCGCVDQVNLSCSNHSFTEAASLHLAQKEEQ